MVGDSECMVSPMFGNAGEMDLDLNQKLEMSPVDYTCTSRPRLESRISTLFGGGSTVARTYSIEELETYLKPADTFEPGVTRRYELIKYVHRDSLDEALRLIPHAFSLSVPLHLLCLRFNLAELKTLAHLHNIDIPRRQPKEATLALIKGHHCTVCDDYVSIFVSASVSVDLLNQTFRPEYIESVASKVKVFSLEEIAELTALHPALRAAYSNGARFTSIQCRRPNDDDMIPTNEKRLICEPVPWLHIARKGPKVVALQLAQLHGIMLPSRTSKEEIITELGNHACVQCRKYYAVFEAMQPLPPRVRNPSSRRIARSPCPSDTGNDDSNAAPVRHELPIFQPDENVKFPPPPLTESATWDIVRDYCQGMQPVNFEEAGCAVCGQLTLRKNLTPLTEFRGSLSPLEEPNMARVERHNATDAISFETGPVLDRRCDAMCPRCLDSLSKGRRPRHSLANGLWVGAVPDVLSQLTWVEQILISRVRTNRYVVRVSATARKVGLITSQSKMTANAIAFAAPTAKVYQLLPPKRSELDEVLAVIFTGHEPPTDQEIESRTPMLCRRNAVAAALDWLKLNHSDYSDLQIDKAALLTYPLKGIPVKVVFKKTDNPDGNVIASATSVHDNVTAQGTDEGECPMTVHGLIGTDLSNMSTVARKAIAVDHLKTGGHVLSVGHAEEPESIFNNHQLYPQTFPWLFPYGLGGVGNPRTRGLVSTTSHKKYLLQYHDKRFQTDTRFVIMAFNHEQIRNGSRGSFILARKSNFDSIVSNVSRVNPVVMKSISNRLQAGEKVIPNTEDEKLCFSVMDQIDHVGGQVQGSLAGKKHMRNELWSLIAFRGAPSWFVTLSPVDNKHPICIYWADRQINFTPDLRQYKDRARLVAQNPVAGARFFHFLVELFIKHMLRWADDDGRPGLFGKTAAYYGTVEQQGRMTLHLHILIWIMNALNPQKVRDILMGDDSEFQQELIAYLESCQVGEFLTGTMEDLDDKFSVGLNNCDDPTSRLPVGPPTTDCVDFDQCDCLSCSALKKWRKEFRDTVDNVIYRSNVHECYNKRGVNKDSSMYEQHAMGKGCINKDGICTSRFPREIFQRTTVDKEGRVFLKKKEQYINTVTPVLCYGFGCNTDTTSLNSGTAVKATVGYVADYIVKMGLKTYQIFSSIYDVFERNEDIWSESKSSSDAARRLILKMANSLTAKIEIGGPMAAMYLLNNPDHYASHTFVPLYWKPYVANVLREWESAMFALEGDDDDREYYGDRIGESDISSVHRSFDVPVDAVPEELEPQRVGADESIMIAKSAGQYISKSSVDDYKLRPPEFDEVCLYEWTQCNVRKYLKTAVGRGTSASGKQAEPHYRYRPEHPLYHTHAVVFDARRLHSVVPTLVSSFLPRADSDDRDYYCCTMLTLFAPWRTGLDLRTSSQTWPEAFDCYAFTDRHLQIIENLNIRYECYDARDDFHAQLNLRIAQQEEDLEGEPDDVEEDDGEDGDLVATLANDGESEVEIGAWTQRRRDQMKDVEAVLHEAGWVVNGVSDDFSQQNSFCPERLLGPTKWRDIVASERKREINSRTNAVPNNSRLKDDMDIDTVARDDARIIPGAWLLDEFKLEEPILKEQLDKVSRTWTLNEEQMRAYKIIAQHALSVNPTPLLMHIGGPGGTGKTRIIKAILEWFETRHEGYRMAILAPTGAAASVVQGSTYHSFLGVLTGERRRSETSEASLEEARSKLKGVDYIFLDEISMVSCQDLHLIDARLKAITGVDDVPFGGINMIVAGDFAQLPPAKGHSLYSGEVSKVQLPRQTQTDQEETLGMLLWHQFLVVVILKQNMRQAGLDPDDDKLRLALNHMRYKDCTPEDIAWLRSRIPCWNPSLSMNDDRWRDVSIITALNSQKDQINVMNASRFAHERKMKLHHFYSIDRQSLETGAKKRRRLKTATTKRPIRLNQSIQEAMWKAPPHTSEHVAGCVSLCLDMPVMIRNNEATELCITKGQEAVVKGWTSKEIPGYRGRLALETLFVELVKPAKSIQLPYLPRNVVPLTKRPHSIKAVLPNDQSLTISRQQVPVLPNFSMTDYGSQGKTREINVVDLTRSRNHQAVYTALSRGVSGKDTIIMRDFNPSKICGGLSGFLRQEFRELDILDEMTALKYAGKLPHSVVKRLRESTLASFAKWKSGQSMGDRLEGVGSSTVAARSCAKRKAIDQGVNVRPSKRKKACPPAPGIHATYIDRSSDAGHSSMWTRSWVWDSNNWSCAYDSLWTTIRCIWHSDVEYWSQYLAEISNLGAGLNAAFHALTSGSTTLQDVRDVIRSQLNEMDPISYPFGRVGMDIYSLANQLLGVRPETSVSHRTCSKCNDSFVGSTFEGLGKYVIVRHSVRSLCSTNNYAMKLEGVVGRCPVCRGRLMLDANTYPSMMFMQLPQVSLRSAERHLVVDEVLQLRGASYTLRGVVYHNAPSQHFTCRLIAPSRVVYNYDGMLHGGVASTEVSLTPEIPKGWWATSSGGVASLALYTRSH